VTAKLTIAIPTFNRSRLLRRALESAIAQKSEAIEILVSDNGSTDDTPRLISAYQDPRLRKMRREDTVSRAMHGTLIFAAVKTEFVLVLSDDDYIDPDFSTDVLALFSEHPQLSFVYTGCIEHYDELELPALVGPRVEPSLDFIAAHFDGRRQVSWCACVTRTEDLRRIGPQPEDRICGDMYFWTRIAFQGPVGCVVRPLSHYTALLPGGDNESRTTPVLAWARDVERLTIEVRQSVLGTDATDGYRRSLDGKMKAYLTRSIANQFIWARIFGMSRAACWAILPAALRFKGWRPGVLIRVISAMIIPRIQLRNLTIHGIARLAKKRRFALSGRMGGRTP
jgi:Glycosyl transferase family 2